MKWLLFIAACFFAPLSVSAAVLTPSIVLPDREECQKRFERVSASEYVCAGKGKNIAEDYSGQLLPEGNRTFRFQGCRVVVAGVPGGYQVSIIQEPIYPRRFLTENSARQCLSEAFDIAGLGELPVSALVLR